MGNGDADAAEHYFKRLTRITLLISSAWNLLIFLLTPFFMKFYALQPETKRLVIWLVLIHNVFNAAAYPFSGALSNGLRAAGDVKFTMYVSVISTIAVRLLLSWLLGIVLKMGVDVYKRQLVPWVRDDTFLEGTFWQDSLHRYHRFLRHWIMAVSYTHLFH